MQWCIPDTRGWYSQGFIINNAMYAMQHTLTKRYAKSNAMQNT